MYVQMHTAYVMRSKYKCRNTGYICLRIFQIQLTVLMDIYCIFKSTVVKLLALKISHYTEVIYYFPLPIIKYSIQ